jgi:drug/metabolite transporter (DMT)-like permease
MKFSRQLILYAGLIAVFGGLIFYLLNAGNHNTPPFQHTTTGDSENITGSGFFGHLFQENIREALPRLLLQVFIIIAATRLFGVVFRKIGQPVVVGETIAGIVLGPSLLGLLFPDAFHFIFPVESCQTCDFSARSA